MAMFVCHDCEVWSLSHNSRGCMPIMSMRTAIILKHRLLTMETNSNNAVNNASTYTSL